MSLEAVRPVAVVLPELAVVIPGAGFAAPAGVGTSATLTPDFDDAALKSVIVLAC
jgi:hypothetical protein